MAWWKATFFMEAPKAGWSESWFKEGSTVQAVLPACRRLAAWRAGLLGKFATMDVVRVSSVEPPHISTLEFLRVVGSAYQTTDSDVPWNGALVRISDPTEKYQRSQLFRAIPDGWITRDPQNGKVQTAGMQQLHDALQGWINAAFQDGWHFRDRSGEGDGGVSTTITNLTVGADGFLKVEPAGTLAVGDKVTFHQFDAGQIPELRGTHRVTAVAGGVATTGTKPPVTINLAAGIGAKFREKVTGFFPVRYYNVVGASSRDTGRPFGLRRGRRPARKKSPSTPAA